MSMYEWAVNRYSDIKRSRKQRARNRRLNAINAKLLAILEDLLGDRPDIQSGTCIRCGRDYTAEPELEGGNCPSDDCPGYCARQICARAKAGAL